MIFLVDFWLNSIFIQPEVQLDMRFLTGSETIQSSDEWITEQLFFFKFSASQMSVSGLNLKSLADRTGFSMLIGLEMRDSDWSIVSGNTLIGWLNWAWPNLDMSNIFQSTESKTNTKPKRNQNQKNRNRNTNNRSNAIVPGLDQNFETKFIT